jgi:cell division protein FtsN
MPEALAFVSADWRLRSATYGVQIASYRSRPLADEAAEHCSRALAAPCDVAQVSITGRGVWHRVIAGRLGTVEEAWELRRRIADPGATGPVVRVLPPDPPAVDTKGEAARFALQVASLRERTTAERLAAELGNELGVDSRVMTVDLGERGVWHRVLLGSFETQDDARMLGRRIPPVEGAGAGLAVRLPIGS